MIIDTILILLRIYDKFTGKFQGERFYQKIYYPYLTVFSTVFFLLYMIAFLLQERYLALILSLILTFPIILVNTPKVYYFNKDYLKIVGYLYIKKISYQNLISIKLDTKVLIPIKGDISEVIQITPYYKDKRERIKRAYYECEIENLVKLLNFLKDKVKHDVIREEYYLDIGVLKNADGEYEYNPSEAIKRQKPRPRVSYF